MSQDSTKTPDRPRPRGPLYMDQACALIGWVDPETKEPTRSHRDRLRLILNAEQRKTGRKYLFGGSSDAGWSKCWTTAIALEELKLLPANTTLLDEARAAFLELHEDLNEVRERLDTLGEQVIDNRKRIADAQRRRSAGFVEGT